MKVAAIVPAYNEAGRVADVVRALARHADFVIVVDDGSSDRTAEAALEAGAVVLVHAVNRGQGAALKTGTEAALRHGADIIVHIDADGQHDPEALPKLVAPIMAGETDVVFGSRFLGAAADGMPFSRKLLLRAARVFSAFALGLPERMTDPQSGLRALSATAARQVDFHQDRMAHCSEILRLVTHSPLRWTEVPITVRYTRQTLAKGQKAGDAFGIVWQLFLGGFR